MMRKNSLENAFTDQARSFDAIYTGSPDLVRGIWNRLTRQNIQQRFDFALQAGQPWSDRRVLDVGCGPGRYCVEIARRGAADVVGLDLSPGMLQLARIAAVRSKLENHCHFVCQDIMDYDDPNGFDVVIANGFFDYVNTPAVVLQKLRRLTRHSFIASFPAKGAMRVPFRWCWWRLKGVSISFFTQSEVLMLCQRAGFVVHTIVRHGPIYTLLAH